MTGFIYTAAGPADHQFHLQLDGSGNIRLLDGFTILDSRPLASVDSYTINGADGNDTLVIQDLIALPVFFNGGLPNGPPGDAIVLSVGNLVVLRRRCVRLGELHDHRVDCETVARLGAQHGLHCGTHHRSGAQRNRRCATV